MRTLELGPWSGTYDLHDIEPTAPILEKTSVNHGPLFTDLLLRITARLNDAAEEQANKYGLQAPGARVLTCLLERGRQRVGDLADQVNLDPSTASHLLKRLERDGWIVRRRDRDDNRTVIVSLTSKGRSAAKQLQSFFEQSEDQVLRGFSEKNINRLKNLLGELRDNIDTVEQDDRAAAGHGASSTRSR